MKIYRRKYEKNINRIILLIGTLVGISIFLHLQNNLISITEVNICKRKKLLFLLDEGIYCRLIHF